MRKTKGMLLVGLAVITVMSLAACSLTKNLDVVGKDSIHSFDAVLKKIPNQVKADEMNGGWALAAPDGSVSFIWSEDYSNSPVYDVMLVLDAKPFIDAGLNIEKLSNDYVVYEDKLMVGTKLGNNTFKYDGEATRLASYEQIVTLYRDRIGYHTALDHYGIKLGDGNLFEWAKDMKSNDKDIVFVLNPEPLIKAGVDPAKVEGWVFAKVPVEESGKTIEVDKFLKPFNLDE